MNDSLPAIDPAPYRKRIGIVMETAEQVKKDLGLFSIEIHISGRPESAYEELHTQLMPAVSDMLQRDPGLFRELLYRIDVDEHKLARMLSLSGNDAMSEASVYTELIIEREFRKVITRHYFKEKRLKD